MDSRLPTTTPATQPVRLVADVGNQDGYGFSGYPRKADRSGHPASAERHDRRRSLLTGDRRQERGGHSFIRSGPSIRPLWPVQPTASVARNSSRCFSVVVCPNATIQPVTTRAKKKASSPSWPS